MPGKALWGRGEEEHTDTPFLNTSGVWLERDRITLQSPTAVSFGMVSRDPTRFDLSGSKLDVSAS